jgi:ribulose-phosphate 3-epimerase
MHAVKLSPSMMCVDFAKMQETVDTFAREGVEYLHVDIMDGEFVPNFTLGVDFCQKLRKMSNIPLDIHLMITKPENKLEWFAPQPGEYISVHWESTVHMQRTLAKIHSFGAKTMVALNPATPITVIEEVLEDLDAVLLMTVNPGYAGQKLVPATIDKIRRMRAFLDERGYSHVRIEVDGNVSFENAVKMRAAGADIFVAGSSSVFSKEDTIENNIKTLRKALAE